MAAKGRKPDYNLSMLDKVTDMRGQVGVAWNNPNGTIAIRLNPCVVLDGSNKELVLTLFPNEQDRNAAKSRSTAAVAMDDDRRDGFFVEDEEPPPGF